MLIDFAGQIGNDRGLNVGEVSEWLKVHPWKGCVRESVPGVRIPPSPPFLPLAIMAEQLSSRQ